MFFVNTPASISSLKSQSSSPSTLVSLFSRNRSRSLSSTACSLSLSALPIDDDASILLDSGVADSKIIGENSKTLLKGMRYSELEKWVQSHGFRPGQAMMLWKRLYGNNVWAHSCDELEGLNKDLRKMLSVHAEFKALSLRDVRTASDGTRKEIADIIHIGGWTGD